MTSAARVAAPGAQVQGDVQGSIVYGDNSFVVNSVHGTLVYPAVPFQLTRRPAASPFPEPPQLFLDRQAELTQILAALAEGKPVALTGADGIGKSALMQQAANSVAPYPDGAVLVLGETFTGLPQGLDDLAQAVFNTIFDSEPMLKVTAGTIRGHLAGVQALYVLDDLTMPPEALDQLPDLLPSGGLMWAASNAPNSETTCKIELGSLPRAEAVSLFIQTAELDPEQVKPETIEEICERVEDSPLALVSLARWMRQRKAKPEEALRSLRGQTAAREKDGLSRAFTGIMVWVGAAALRIFRTAAAANGPAVERAALMEASGYDEATTSTALDHLQTLGLLELHGSGLRMHPAVRQFARRKYPAAPITRRKIFDAFVRDAQAHWGELDHLQAQAGNLLGVLQEAAASDNTARAVEVARLLVPLIVLRGQWDLWLLVFQRIADVATKAGDQALQAWSLHELGTRALAAGDKDGATRLLTEALRVRRSLGDRTGAAHTRHNLRHLTGEPPEGDTVKSEEGGLGLIGVLAFGASALIILAAVAAALFYCQFFPC